MAAKKKAKKASTREDRNKAKAEAKKAAHVDAPKPEPAPKPRKGLVNKSKIKARKQARQAEINKARG
jgi:hypothetical protein